MSNTDKLQEIKQAYVDYDVLAIIDEHVTQEELDVLKMVVEYVPSLITQLEQAQADMEQLERQHDYFMDVLGKENEQLKQAAETVDSILKEAIESLDNGEKVNGLEYARQLLEGVSLSGKTY